MMHGAAGVLSRAGLLGRVGDPQVAGVEGVVLGSEIGAHAALARSQGGLVDLQCRQRHRAVHVDGYGGYLAGSRATVAAPAGRSRCGRRRRPGSVPFHRDGSSAGRPKPAGPGRGARAGGHRRSTRPAGRPRRPAAPAGSAAGAPGDRGPRSRRRHARRPVPTPRPSRGCDRWGGDGPWSRLRRSRPSSGSGRTVRSPSRRRPRRTGAVAGRAVRTAPPVRTRRPPPAAWPSRAARSLPAGRSRACTAPDP